MGPSPPRSSSLAASASGLHASTFPSTRRNPRCISIPRVVQQGASATCFVLSKNIQDPVMGISKTEINLRRLLAATTKQQNQAKLIHYVSFMREQLEQLAEERNPDGLPRVSKAKVNDYSQRIEAIASTIAVASYLVSEESFAGSSAKESPKVDGETHFPASLGLRKRFVAASNIDDGTHDNNQVHTSAPVKLDTTAKAHIENHRKLQEDLTDEMVQLAQQLKESSLLMSQSVENTEKILDSTEKAVEMPTYEPLRYTQKLPRRHALHGF